VIARAGLRVIDLAQELGPETAVWPGMPRLASRTTETYAEHGAFARELTFNEHTGTHLDAPAHFHEGGEAVECIRAAHLVCEVAVLDLREACSRDHDYLVSEADVLDHERAHGPIVPGMAVLVLTGWSAFLREPGRYVEDLHYPGLGPEAARLLVARGAIGIGIDTLSVDAGISTEYPVHHIVLPAGLWQLEGLVCLEQLPPRGALLVVGAPRLVGGSGVPARPLALVPASTS
jgi:kynurenine formamidase